MLLSSDDTHYGREGCTCIPKVKQAVVCEWSVNSCVGWLLAELSSLLVGCHGRKGGGQSCHWTVDVQDMVAALHTGEVC